MREREPWKRILSGLLTVVLLWSALPIPPIQAAKTGGEYTIANEYIRYTINFRTGGFCIETKDGHPQKSFDDNMPLLYKEDTSRSNGTSFTTVRIDGKDYIFGQDYSWFGITSTLHMPVISEEGRLLTVDWDIKGYTITQKVAISLDENNPLCGNIGISYTVKNNSGKTGDVGIRLLLDNALDNQIDAPYVMVNQISPTLVETEYTEKLPQEFRYMDSVSAPSKMAYALLGGWSGTQNVSADKVIVGHWVNLANTRYAYTPNPSCDFSNYSNEYLVPDTATAYYWTEKPLQPGESRVSELLYGIGNFANELSGQHMGINMDVEKLEVDTTGNAYANDGVIHATVTLDNSVDGACILLEPLVTLTLEDGLTFKETGTNEYQVKISGGLNIGSIYQIPVEIVAKKQAQITSRRLVAAVSATEVVDQNTQKFVEYSSNRTILIPALGGLLPRVSMRQVNPTKVYYEGEKSVTVSGDMKELSEALAGSDGWSLHLVSAATQKKILIDKKNISFVGEGKTMSFSTNEPLEVGRYQIEFSFTDEQLKKSFGVKIRAAVSLEVSNDPRDRCASYGVVAMVRFPAGNHRQTYDFVSFSSEEELASFTEGEVKKSGLQHKSIQYTDDAEILLVVRGKLRQMTDQDGTSFYQANREDGDITLNNILSYSGEEPLKLTCDQDTGALVSGDGTLRVINSINVWHDQWSLQGENGTKYSLDGDEIEEKNAEAFELSLDGAGSMLQFLGGFLIDLKFGVMTMDDDLYGISFGGKITLPIKAGTGGDTDAKAEEAADGEEDQDDGALSAEIEDVLFGEKEGASIGFLGINTTISVKLPEDVMGSLVKNAFGIEAEVTINTIENIYKLDLALELEILECQGTIAFKQVPIMSIPRVVPDELFFYLGGDIVQIPIVPPFVSMTGLGGGVSELADTMSDDTIGELPPITIKLKTQLLMIETLVGDFELELSLSSIKFEGELKLKGDDDGKILKMNAGLSARWLTPFYINAYGKISICDGLLRGGFTIKISDDYFYGYVYAGLFIPDDIPLVGGMELAGIEAAISSDFIGANIAIIGIKLGFIYYWDGDFQFGSGIDLSSRGKAVTVVPDSYLNGHGETVDYTAVYGTNLRRLTTQAVAATRASNGVTKNFDPTQQDAILLEIPLDGTTEPSASEIVLKMPNGTRVPMQPEDGQGGGNYLIQTRKDKKYLYITITDPAQLLAGDWSLSINKAGVSIRDFQVNGVDCLPELTDVTFTHVDQKSRELTVQWKTDSSSEATGTLDVYLSKNPNALKELEKSETDENSTMAAVARIPLERMTGGSSTVTLPDTFEEGDYYVVAMLSEQQGGMSKAISKTKFTFTNEQLPAAPEAVSLRYHGNGSVAVDVAPATARNGNYYLVSLLDTAGNEVENSYGKFGVESPIVIAPKNAGSNESALIPGEAYRAKVTALQETTTETGENLLYYSTNSTVSAPFVMPAQRKPRLVSVSTNLPSGTNEVITKQGTYEATYTFDMPVAFQLQMDGSTAWKGKEYKAVWVVSIPVEDGTHVVDFQASNEQNDRCTGRDFAPLLNKNGAPVSVQKADVIPNAQLGFVVDTAPPILALGEEAVESMDANAPQTTVSNQTVFVDEDGYISLKGLTEKSASLTLDGTTEGVSIQTDGTFVIHRKTNVERANDSVLLKAVDQAGNESSLKIAVVNRALAMFDSVQLLSDLEQEDKQTKHIEMSVGSRTTLTVKGLREEGTIRLEPEDVTWTILTEQNNVKLSQNGILEALAPGETIIKASYRVAAMEATDGTIVYNEISDLISVNIKDAGYRYSVMQTQGFTLLNLSASVDKGLATVVWNGTPHLLLYDETKKAYVGAFRGTVSAEQLLAQLAFDEKQNATRLLHGDSNGDGMVDEIDVSETLKIVLEDTFPDANQWLRANENSDEVLNVADAQLILNRCLESKGVGK